MNKLLMVLLMVLLMHPFMSMKFLFWDSLMYKMYFSLNMNIIYMMFMFSLILIFNNIMYFKIMYMMNGKVIKYFNFLMFLFFSSMMMLILSSSLMMLLVGWEGLGVSSYLLVLYYMNWNSIQGSYLTMITNRFGDSFLLMFMMVYIFNLNLVFFLIIFMMSMTKSAQVPFMSWLPAAMAAPTPVSALVHSSTLVTAGILLFVKYSMPMYLMMIKNYLVMISLITMLSGSISALFSNDVKKIVAFSTLSQLGFMMLTFYSLWFGLVMYHLLVHAFLKSFMFILVGMMIMNMYSQSIFKSCYPIYNFSSISMFLMIFMSFCNMLFSMMFFSKEISNLFMMNNLFFMKMVYFLIMIITLMYMMRLYFMFNKILFMNKINIINKFHMTKLNLSYFMINTIMGLMWLMNMIKFKFNLVMWNLLMMLVLFMSFLKFKFLNMFILLTLINNQLNKLMLILVNMMKEELLVSNLIYNFSFLKTTLLNWVILLNLMLFILVYLSYIEFLIQFKIFL